MTNKEVRDLCEALNGDIAETHISWVILTSNEAFKIKKPVTYSFLDFSALDSRKFFCEEEFRLNSRLTDIYREVRPIRQFEGEIGFQNEGEVIDYAVVMGRQADEDRLDIKLTSWDVNLSDITRIAGVLAEFHRNAKILSEKDDAYFVEKRFRDVLAVADFLQRELGEESVKLIHESIGFHEAFIREHRSLLDERVQRGFKRDLHGDLHTQNIFIGERVVIFDCIEFDVRYRKIDTISELAFLYMDLCYFGRRDLAEYFLQEYQKNFVVFEKEEDMLLFKYYLAYRANVKVKVNGLRAMHANDVREVTKLKPVIGTYLDLLREFSSPAFHIELL